MIGHRSLVRRALRSGEISFGFRERLMMVVTEVNGCRYCSWYHAGQALRAGLSGDELRALLAGQVPEGSPAEEMTALVYAQHWAETNANPDPAVFRRLVETYTEERAALISVLLRMIRAGNLLGNTGDWFLSRMTLGRLGLTTRDA